jgi:TonB-linked SusC/RagA family outer membrane protein
MPLWAVSQTITVKGVVKDASSEPIVGASVIETGTNNGIVTDLDGNFSLKVSSNNAALTISFMGYQTQTIKINHRTSLVVTLEENTQSLNEVVVIGYGTQRKEAVTGSVASMRGDALRDVPGANISRSLQGRVAGVEMSQTSTKPGSSMQIRIRGSRSLKADNDPLIVLDGIPFSGSIGDISTSDIKSIDILKDASATAIYGSRGANGVILITSNKGQMGQKAKATYNGYYGMKKLFSRFPMMSGPEFAALRKASLTKYANTLDESDDTNTDWQDLIFKTGAVTSHDLGVSGGTEKGNYNFGIGYYKDDAVVPLQNYSRYSIRASLDQEIGKYLRFGFSSNSNYSVSNGNNLGAVYAALSASPLASPYNADGTLKRSYLMQTAGAQYVWTREVLDGLGDKYIDQTRSFASYNSLYAEVKVPTIEGLKYRINVGLNYRQSNSGNYTGEGVFSGTPTTPSTASISNSHKTNWAIENMLTYDRTFAEKHNFNVVAMYSAEQTKYNSSNMSAKNIPSDAFQFYNIGQANSADITVNPAYQDYWTSGLMSYMGRIMYSYDDRYMLSMTMRSDGSSRLASGYKWHSYPAVSAGWNIKKESFLNDIKQIDNLKLRVGYGQTSNQAVLPYKTLGLLSNRPYNFGETYSTGLYVSELPNNRLGWEYSETWNVGVDFSFLKNRLSGTIEYYIQDTKDVLLYVGMPPTSGVAGYTDNIGKTQNKGIEFSLNGVILDNLNGWTWEAGVNIYSNKNKLVSLASGQKKDEGNWWFVDNPINVIYDYEKVGLWQEGDPYMSTLEPGTDSKVGMIKVKYTGGYNADGTPTRAIGPDDRQIIDTNPDFQGGFNTRVAYKNFDLGIIGSFKKGGVLISTLYSSSGYLNNMNSRSSNNVKVDYWSPENTGAKYPVPGGPGGDNPKYGSTLGYFDASYLKIRTISLGYNFNQKWLKMGGIDKLRVYATVENPFVFFSPYKDESGMDPEPNSYGNENAAVPYSNELSRFLTVGTNTPTTRNYTIGLNVTF